MITKIASTAIRNPLPAATPSSAPTATEPVRTPTAGLRTAWLRHRIWSGAALVLPAVASALVLLALVAFYLGHSAGAPHR